MDSYGLENCGYCWANAIDGLIQHHENCKIGNLQALADKRLELLKEISEHHLTFGECLFCTMLEFEEGHEHAPDCELAEAIDAA